MLNDAIKYIVTNKIEIKFLILCHRESFSNGSLCVNDVEMNKYLKTKSEARTFLLIIEFIYF